MGQIEGKLDKMRGRIKECFQKNGVQPGAPGRVYVVDQGTGAP